MRKGLVSLLPAFLAPFAAFAANEGVPIYYQTASAANANQLNYGDYANQGYTKYVGSSGSKQVVGTRTYSYSRERQTVPTIEEYNEYMTYTNAGKMTVNGVASPQEAQKSTYIYGGY